MPLDFPRARPLLQGCNLPKLFIEELGWEPARQKLTLRAGETDYAFTAVAEKRGFTAWLCESPGGDLPDHATRLKLDRKLSETSFEHLIVFVTGDRASQSWMWVRREPGKPLAARTHEYHRGQPGDSLLQKLQILYVSLEEEEAGLSTVVVAGRARAAFDIERVTKAFYRDFDTHRKAFLKFIDGIGEVADCEWYASVMLNRLMFVYFIQRKGFLDGDRDYLRNRLNRCKKEQGKDKFYTFYRYFLLRLFHEGFGKRRKDRAPDHEKLIGNIPYLNGGLFDVHELEKPERYGKDIAIPDKAFERIFDYFDQYQWHLDERPLRADNEINPDVLGYIFEKYINQKQMGAYYTKEDITEYISKNTVLPFLFDAARAKCKVAFENPHGPTVWDLLRENPDRYVYPAVRHGTDRKLPPEIAAGLDTTKPNLIERRQSWNKPAPPDYALPTEIWREVVARRQRCEEVRRKLAAGEVREVNDFITLNLDLRQFAQDVIQNCEGPDLLMALWQAITTITVLDPTGGSGAFIFAALNILEPLYEACLDRMEAFLAEWGEHGKKAHPNYHKKFTEVLARVDAHPNRRYFVLKSIILNNLYAVDIMEEAVEICKLRLFLKLAAQVVHHLLSPHRAAFVPAKAHDGRIITDAPNVRWATDGAKIWTTEDGWVWLFDLVEHWNGECLGWHVCKIGDRFAAWEPLAQAIATTLGGVPGVPGAARGIQLRHDHGSQYLTDSFQSNARFHGFAPSFALLGEPETNGVVERFHRTLKEQIIHGRTYQNLAQLRAAVATFVHTYNHHWRLEKLRYQSPVEARLAFLSAMPLAA